MIIDFFTATTTNQPEELETTTVTLLDQIKKSNKFDSGVSNFARIPLTKFTMKDDSTENLSNEEIESVTFSPDAVTISGRD